MGQIIPVLLECAAQHTAGRAIAKSRSYLAEHDGMDEGRVRQLTRTCALGKVKFVFNSHIILPHTTRPPIKSI
jgi:hypothetical protein